MLCYRDRTYCPYYKECKAGKTCDRALTPQVQKAADKWWGEGEGAPICQFAEHPDCFKEIKK